jgi:hypothetical protein
MSDETGDSEGRHSQRIWRSTYLSEPRTNKILVAACAMISVFGGTLRADDLNLAPVSQAQVRIEGNYLFAYFLDEPPSDIGTSTLPAAARDVVVARVSLIQRPIYLVGRDQSGMPPPPTEYLFRAQFHVVEVLSGPAAVGENFDVTFAKPNGSGRMTMVPRRDELNRDFFVIAYLDEGGRRHLAAYPISEDKYRAWEAVVLKEIRTFR